MASGNGMTRTINRRAIAHNVSPGSSSVGVMSGLRSDANGIFAEEPWVEKWIERVAKADAIRRCRGQDLWHDDADCRDSAPPASHCAKRRMNCVHYRLIKVRLKDRRGEYNHTWFAAINLPMYGRHRFNDRLPQDIRTSTMPLAPLQGLGCKQS